MTATSIDVHELEDKVQALYQEVAEHPGGRFHFEMGRSLAERLGYPMEVLDQIPTGAVDSFAGVGYFFDMAELQPGERVLDLGSGSGMDAFFAALTVGERGEVQGLDMTDAQLRKAERLRAAGGLDWVRFTSGHIEELPFPEASFDVVVSNGVINLSPAKAVVFAEAARVLSPGGRLAVADIVSEKPLTEKIVCNTDLWASCIGGAAQEDAYQNAIASAGFEVEQTRTNDYHFLSRQALNASNTYGVKSVSVLARRT